MNFDNKIIPNFCSDEELAFLDKFIVENTTAWNNYLNPNYQKEGDAPVLNAVSKELVTFTERFVDAVKSVPIFHVPMLYSPSTAPVIVFTVGLITYLL